MNRKNNVAIFIRGFKRTWDWLKTNNFALFESVYGNNIDWYVAVWNHDTIDTAALKEDFNGKNLKAFIVLDEQSYPIPKSVRGHNTPTHFNSWVHKLDEYWRLSYMDQLLGYEKLKFETESKTQYRSVIFTRFDLYHFCPDVELEQTVDIKPFTISTNTDSVVDFDFNTDNDRHYKTDSITADIVSSRFFDTHVDNYYTQAVPLPPEVLLSNYLFRNNIIYDRRLNNFISYLIRPDQCGVIDLPTKYFGGCIKESAWLSESTEYKLYHCRRCEINPVEYNIFL